MGRMGQSVSLLGSGGGLSVRIFERSVNGCPLSSGTPLRLSGVNTPKSLQAVHYPELGNQNPWSGLPRIRNRGRGCDPGGIRTLVSAVKGQGAEPLHYRVYVWILSPARYCANCWVYCSYRARLVLPRKQSSPRIRPLEWS